MFLALRCRALDAGVTNTLKANYRTQKRGVKMHTNNLKNGLIKLSRQEGRMQIEVSAIPMGKDFCVVINGGEVPHLGAVAISQSRASLDDPNELSASTSVFALVGHKEDEVARKAAHTLTKNSGKNTVVCCGIHLPNITAEEIEITNKIVESMTMELVELIK